MTALSEKTKDAICIYCGNNEGGCVANVPYYCVSIWCKFFVEKGVEQTDWELYRDRRISLKMAIWAMKNVGYAREETAEWLGLASRPIEKTGEK